MNTTTEKKFASSLNSETRKISDFLSKEYSLDEILALVLELNHQESNLITDLQNRLGNIKFHKSVQTLCDKISKTAPASLLAEAQKQLDTLNDTQSEKQPTAATLKKAADLHLFIRLLTPYATLFKRCTEAAKQSNFEQIKQIFAQTVTDGRVYDEDRLYLLQTIKHVTFILKNKISLTYRDIFLFAIAFNSDFSDEIALYQKQTDLLLSTYKAISDPAMAQKVKEICYKFIAEVFKRHNILSASLILFPFWGGWISRETYELFSHNLNYLDKFGLKELVLTETLKLYKEVEKKFATNEPLSESDKYVISLYNELKK